MFKKFLSLILALVISLSMSSGVFANDNVVSDSLRKEFEDQVSNQLNLTKGVEKADLLKEYNKYEALSESDKEKFVESINNIEFMNKLVKLSETPAINVGQIDNEKEKIRRTKVADDVIVEDKIEDSPLNIIEEKGISVMAAASTRIATYTKSVKFLGVNVLQIKNSLTYKRTSYGGRITEIISSSHRVTRNLTVNRVSYSNKYERFSNTRATSTMDYTVALLFKGKWTYGDGESKVTVDNRGNASGYFLGTMF